MITVSIVSHGHDEFVSLLLKDLNKFREISKVILTNNIPQSQKIEIPIQIKPKTVIINNNKIKGFSSNHNSAFEMCDSKYFCIINPDVSIYENPFPSMLKLFNDTDVAVVSPAVLNDEGIVEDNARKYPTLLHLLSRKFGINNDTYDYKLGGPNIEPDWLAGIFLLIRSDYYTKIGGLDEKNFFMYCEDIDFCLRLKRMEKKIILTPSVHIVHYAQRESRKKVKYLLFHLHSMMNYYKKYYL